MVANPARGQRNRGNYFPLPPFASVSQRIAVLRRKLISFYIKIIMYYEHTKTLYVMTSVSSFLSIVLDAISEPLEL